MAEAVVGATIQVLLENLLTLSTELIGEQIGLVWNFKDDLKNLQKYISMVNDVLHDAEKRQVTDRAVKRWLGELEALAFDADNVFDEISYRLLSKKVGAATKKEKVKSFFSSSSKNPIAYRLKLGRRIKDINEKLKSINRQASEFGLQTRIASAHADPVSGKDASETDSFTVDSVFIGRENDMSSIVETLVIASQSEQNLSVLPIVGMGGLGKTTLVRKLLNHEQIKSHFGDKRVWVHVPRTFDVVVLFEKILTSMGTESHVPQGNREALLKKLQEHLGAKKYLLVLDDVWNEDREKWDGFVNSLFGISSATGNCMIVTTRKHETVSIVNTLHVHELKCLSKDDCWSIIQAKAFIRVGDDTSEFEAIGINIAEKCQGLPLAAKVVGGLLRGEPKDEWSIEKNWLSDYGDKNPMPSILKLSFDNLSSPSLKKCFAYCSLFPKGYEIEKKQMVELWMAEGFLQTDHMEITGNNYFNTIVQNSLLQVVRSDDYGNVTHCNMHDLVHDMAYSILYENDKDTDVIFHSRYIGHKSNGDGLLSVAKGQEKYVRTLFFNGKVSDIRFSDFESLRTLILVSEEDIGDLPASIWKLKHLRYLDISKTRIKYLRDSIGELYHLQTLRVERNLEKLPDSLSCLISLRNLHTDSRTTLPPEIGKFISLQALPYFHVGSEKGYGISELGNLKDLKGRLDICNLENVRDREEAMSADLHGKVGIYHLVLKWGRFRKGGEANDESLLEGLKPHSNLKTLNICEFKGKSLSLLEGLNNLVDICLVECNECEDLPMLGHLQHLKSLYLIGLTKVNSIRFSFYGNIDNCRRSKVVVFPVLERLVLNGMSNLKEWDELCELVVFPGLKYLKIYECTQLTGAPSHFPCLEELEIVGMESGLPLDNICGIKLTSLKRLIIQKIKGLECLPDWLFSNNHNLAMLKISECPKMTHLVPRFGGGGASSLLRELLIQYCSLRELPDDLHSLNALEKLEIKGCPDLKSIPYPISSRGGGQQQPQLGFTSLGELWIMDCFRLTNLPIEMVESCAASLKYLILIELSSITNLGMVIGCLHRMTRLTYLEIKKVPIKDQVPKLSSKDIIGSPSLLRLGMCPSSSSDSSWSYVSFNETVGAMLLQSIGSLGRLELHGKEHWDSLPDQLQHLTSLVSLNLSDFGIETLPEWFGNLSSLEDLRLFNFKKLRHLPSKQAMQRLSKLTHLKIPQIADSEWPKFCHIPSVYVNGRRISSQERKLATKNPS